MHMQLHHSYDNKCCAVEYQKGGGNGYLLLTCMHHRTIINKRVFNPHFTRIAFIDDVVASINCYKRVANSLATLLGTSVLLNAVQYNSLKFDFQKDIQIIS